MKPLKIGNLTLKNPLILAPMLDITNLPFRILCRKAGASLAYTEMLYTNQILHDNKKTKEMLKTCKEDSPLGIQITGNNPEEFKKIVPFLKKSKFALIDLNCGCPAAKIIGTKAGAYLLKDPDKIAEIIKILKQTKKPVTAKIRLGFNKNNVLEIAKAIQSAGTDAITIHARTSSQPYSIPADHNQTKKLKEILKIPIIANGDVNSQEKANELLKFADGIMIGRAAIGNPLIFRQILTGKESSIKENLQQFQEYLKLCKKYKINDIQQIKFLGSNFLKGFEGASKKRNELMKLKTIDEIEDFTSRLIK